EQDRGISEIVTALPLFAMSRRFTLATLAAAETAADFAAVLFTDSPAVNPAQLGEDEWFEAIPVEYRAMVTLPNTWKMQQFKAEHPAATYEMFKREILNEIARCLNMPFNIAAANSSSYNYSSGRLDHQTYFKAIAVERDEWECSVLDKILYAWLWEASDVPGLIPDGAPPFMDWDWQWHWDGREEIDELKSAKAQETRLQSGCTSRIAELQLSNIDVDQNDEENARAYGVTVEEYRAALFKKHFGGTSAEESDEQTSEENPPSSEREEGDAEDDDESEDDSSVEAAGVVLDRW
ncbi:phage portal protein, partial [bacterium]|nr:phage portal protein [bacterium]